MKHLVGRILNGDMIHGFLSEVSVGRRAPAYNREIAEKLRLALAD